MPVDEEVLETVAAALAEGQGEYDEGELAAAYQEIMDALIKGEAAKLAVEGKVSLFMRDGTLFYAALGDGETDEARPFNVIDLNSRRPPG